MSNLLTIQQKYLQLGIGTLPESALAASMHRAGYIVGPNTERGSRASMQDALRYQYNYFGIDPEHRAKVEDIRVMDAADGRVKKIHTRMSRSTTKGGLLFKTNNRNKRLLNRWADFKRRLVLHRPEKLESDARGLVMEGNLAVQWVLNQALNVIAGIRMPSDTIVPRVNTNGRFKDPKAAYDQWDYLKGQVIETFPLWNLSMVRLTPNNYDDMGSLGRPYLDATREVWSKLVMTEENMVLRRHNRAPLRMAHVLKGADESTLDKYRAQVEADQANGNYADYYLNVEGGVTAVQGDANLDQIADVAYLLDTFYAGGPAPKGLFGYNQDLNRDILQDLKQDYFEEIDALQDTLAFTYELGFRLDLLLAGINPDAQDFEICFAERRTDTPNQRADLALKIQALGASKETAFETAGINTNKEAQRLNDQANGNDPYPDILPESSANPAPRVSVTPNNAPKGQSSTTISTRSGK